MSTWLYLVCEDHDPPLEATDESGQHLYDLPQIRADIAARENLADIDPYSDEWDAMRPYFQRNTAAFLRRHPKCRIGIRDEYGHDHPTDAPT